MMNNAITPLEYAEIAHKASNETISISIGVEVLRSIPREYLNPAQLRAMQHLEDAASRLVDLIELMKSADNEMMEP